MKWEAEIGVLGAVKDGLEKHSRGEDPPGPMPLELAAKSALAVQVVMDKLELDGIPEATDYSDVRPS